MGNAGLGLMLLPGESPAREPLTKIEMASQRAADLCKQLLAYSGKGKFVIQPISLSKVVTEMTDLLSSAISRKATIDFDIEDDLPMMEGDVTQIRQVVMNLITNASEALEDGKGTIILKTGVQQLTNDYLTETFIKDPISIGEYVYVEVSDTGCGMSKETISRIFDPFYSTKFTGRGLGLAAVLGIIRGHKGTISVYSEINKGSRIKVFFPSIIISQSEGNISSPPKKFDSGWRSSGNILIIDDELTVRQTLHTLLSNLGFDPMEATGGKVAIELLEESTDYRAIFLDMTMPEMDGAEVFSRIQEIDDSIPVILTSGYNQQDAINRFAAEGLAGFIQKPFQFHDFQALLQKLLDPQ
jgi:CheY-like chemotaxis protein